MVSAENPSVFVPVGLQNAADASAGGLGPDLPGRRRLPPLERSLADWEAREADQQLTRMRLVEHFTSVSGHYVGDQPDFDRFAEMVQLVEEAIAWIEDKPWKGQPSFGPQRAVLNVGTPIAVDQRLKSYRVNRRQAVQQLTDDLTLELEGLMRPTP